MHQVRQDRQGSEITYAGSGFLRRWFI